jgi:hypothetical protein
MNELVVSEQQAAAAPRRQTAGGRRVSWADVLGALTGGRIGLARRSAAGSVIDEEAALTRALHAVERVERLRELEREVDVALVGYNPDPVGGRW